MAQSASPGIKLPLISRDRGEIAVNGAREHNLKNLDLTLPKRKLVVFTGPSGSGKSSMAFDTLYAEGRRRYVESLSTYARQFLGQIEKPDFDQITGLSPTISIEQKTTGSNPRSTVGTITEVHDHLRVLWARLGEQRCHTCDEPVSATSAQAVATQLLELPRGTKFMLLAPLVRNRKGEYRDLFDALRKQGFVRARIDGEFVELEGLEKLKKSYRHDIDVVVDRLVAKPEAASRVQDSVDRALHVGEGKCLALAPAGQDVDWEERLFSTERACASCGTAFPELTHQSFSFNSPLGMCPGCQGIGATPQVDRGLLVVDEAKSLGEGAIEAIGPLPAPGGRKWRWHAEVADLWEKLQTSAQAQKIPLDRPWAKLSESARQYVLEGPQDVKRGYKGFRGVVPFIEKAHEGASSKGARDFFTEFMGSRTCPECEGRRLRPESRAVVFRGESLAEINQLDIDQARAFFEQVELQGREVLIAEELLAEIRRRLRFLKDVGLSYLTLNRAAGSLSGGESQRIRLASQLGSELSGVLYVLDEPSIGLHQRDHNRLLSTLEELRDAGNSVIVVEHDRETMERADLLVDFGPGAGRLGGEIVAVGTPDEVCQVEGSVTGDYLSGRRRLGWPETRRAPAEGVWIRGARENNLKDVDVHIPSRAFVCVTGVSGAGKSTLVNDILYPAIARKVYFKHRSVGEHDAIEGLERYDKVIEIDQSPIGRTPRSNPATYTKVFDHIRGFFAELPESKMYGFEAGRFSFNVAGGRCEACKGAGVNRVEMSFLADVYVPCNLCLGNRFNASTLRVRYRGHSIADVLEMTIAEAADLFEAHPKIRRILQTLLDVGLDYMKLGQASPTLSGGEAQRVKLSRELAKLATGDTLYILDEPSTGLHFEDIRKLLKVVDQLVDAGNTVVMIEHNTDIIAYADHVIDVGPEGGVEGGHIVAQGTPEEVAQVEGSYTGTFLRELFEAAAE
ncbi:excinuclease ABC subunit UvrA [Lujinxingia litoralis]|uniref:UvrABC system protein A n=1 Tax=Lujinxingia litoralis TaxID=2211119 RepID=A0A328CAD2_9DELT|nr:excinuclease ABC subunit UvrA [Lujinxingia litoralis]RAL22823.1 excinuclease ABC subunit UvrA [Lujinxingia litoralis]